jgi:general secretion pathway protein J
MTPIGDHHYTSPRYRGARCAGQEGTTLLELLVAIALLALLCSYAFGALRHLQSFNLVIQKIEDANSTEALAAHLRRTIAGSRVAFFTTSEARARLAFIGEENGLSLVTDADSRLEWGGLSLVQFGVEEDESGGRRLVAFRRVFRPQMAADPGDSEPIRLGDHIEALQFRYFGSQQEGGEARWSPTWLSAEILPEAVEVAVTFADGRRWPPLVIAIPAAK